MDKFFITVRDSQEQLTQELENWGHPWLQPKDQKFMICDFWVSEAKTGKKVKAAYKPSFCGVAHQLGAYPSFCSMKRHRSFFTPPWMGCFPITLLPSALNLLVHTHLYTWVEPKTGRCLTLWVVCLIMARSALKINAFNPACE